MRYAGKNQVGMKARFTINFCLCLLFCATVLIVGCLDIGSKKRGSVSFVDDVKPILQTHCIRCHNDETIMAGLNMMNREQIMKGSDRGPILIPGQPDKSLLYEATLLPANESHSMPATGPKLTDPEREIVRKWIEEGAEWPEGPDGTMAPVRAVLERA
jgi:uncharacterized membrane protein